MSRKIVLVGPSGVGKTTLRKVFFEYQSAEHLLQFALDPTHGVESFVLELGTRVGIFDLAGQENDSWLSGEAAGIFHGTNYVIVVVDVRSAVESMFDFIRKVVAVRDEACPDAIIHVLVHKIDLVQPAEASAIQHAIQERMKELHRVKLDFTSITRAHFLATINIFKHVMTMALGDEIPVEGIDISVVKDSLRVLKAIKNTGIMNIPRLQALTRLPDSRLGEIVDLLEMRQVVRVAVEALGARTVVIAPGKGDEFIDMLERYSRENLGIIEMGIATGTGGGDPVPPFVGFLVAEVHGRSIFHVETRECDLGRFLGMKDGELTMELIPAFISALSSFSKEFRIINLGDFKIRGHNSMMYVYEYKQFNMITFLNSSTNIEPFTSEIQAFFRRFVDTHEDTFNTFLRSGMASKLETPLADARAWLSGLVASYRERASTNDMFDLDVAKKLYGTLDLLPRDGISGKDIVELKKRLVTAIMESNSVEISAVSRAVSDLASKAREARL